MLKLVYCAVTEPTFVFFVSHFFSTAIALLLQSLNEKKKQLKAMEQEFVDSF